jgi:hypothetical protein
MEEYCSFYARADSYVRVSVRQRLKKSDLRPLPLPSRSRTQIHRKAVRIT